jgi:signal transduction histidine kinase
LHTFEVEPPERERYFFEGPAGFWWWRTSSSPTGASRSISIDEKGLRLRESEPAIPDGFQALHPNRSLIAVSFRFRDDWRGRLLLLDPKVAMPRERGVLLLRTLVEQVGPTVHSVYLASRLRAQARAIERSRVAAEIHDGAIQSLIAVELEIEALRRQMGGDANGVAKDLAA